jgi:hypothetical protein
MTAPINYYRAASGLLDGLPPKTGLIKPKTLIVWGAMDTALLVCFSFKWSFNREDLFPFSVVETYSFKF